MRQFEVTIDHINENGAGVGMDGRYAIAVDKTLPGERIRVEYNPARSRRERLRMLEIITPAAERRDAPCSFFADCGGCQLQHIDEERQMAVKADILRRALSQYPQLAEVSIAAVEGMDNPWGYRNKSLMPFQRQRGEVVYGLFRSGSHAVVPIDQCRVEGDAANTVLEIVREWAAHFSIPVYDERRHKGLLRHVMVRSAFHTDQLMVVLVTTEETLPQLMPLTNVLTEQFPALTSLQLNINPADTNTILGERNIVLHGTPFIEERLLGNRFRIDPHTFFQVNTLQAEKLLQRMMAATNLRAEDSVVDLFCGVGALALTVAGQVKQAYGVEQVGASVAAARVNARDNGIGNVDWLEDDATAGFQTLQSRDIHCDVVITDPPRKGLSSVLIDQICAAAPREIVYISCNPGALARDLAHFADSGFRTDTIYPFDMFPQTAHIESLTVLRRK